MATSEVDKTKLQKLLRDAPLPLIAARIRRARKNVELSHDKFGALMDPPMIRQTLINLEKGKHRPGLETVERIAAAAGKPIEYFLVEEAGEPNPFPAEAA